MEWIPSLKVIWMDKPFLVIKLKRKRNISHHIFLSIEDCQLVHLICSKPKIHLTLKVNNWEMTVGSDHMLQAQNEPDVEGELLGKWQLVQIMWSNCQCKEEEKNLMRICLEPRLENKNIPGDYCEANCITDFVDALLMLIWFEECNAGNGKMPVCRYNTAWGRDRPARYQIQKRNAFKNRKWRWKTCLICTSLS